MSKIEEFIEYTSALLTARPDSTRISFRYTHKNVTDEGNRVDAAAKPARMVFKAYCPRSGVVYKCKAKKANDLSRILASLGPHNFEFANGRKRGMASILSGVEVPDVVESVEAVPEKVEAPKEAAKEVPKKKKKGKKH